MLKKINFTVMAIILILMLSSCAKPSSEVPVSSPNQDVQDNNQLQTLEPEISEEEKTKLELEQKLAEREETEKQNKDKYGEFYVPLVPIGHETEKKNVEVKALYATAHTASNNLNKENIDAYGAYVKALSENDKAKADELLTKAELANNFEKIVGIAVGTEINALVINVKDDNGFITYESDVPIVKEMNEDTIILIKDIKQMLQTLKEYDIYTIGRIVAFKDKHFAVAKPEHAIQLKTGGIWLDPNSGNIPWINPFDQYVWDYNISIAKEVALIGFDEIQFDYVRFPDGAQKYNLITEFPGREGRDKDEAIRDFLKYAKEELEPYNVNLGADVFGLITKNWDDYPEDIGQTWILMGEYIDNICPMVYPSHYSTGWYGFDNPNANPYGVVKGAMEEALEKNSAMENSPIIRPWIQDFDWAGINYGPKEVRGQILAGKELGINEYMVWNPSNKYDPYCFIPTEEEKNTLYPSISESQLDYRGRTPADAADKYFSGKLNQRYSYMYLTVPIATRSSNFDEFVKQEERKNEKLLDYKIYDYEIDPDNRDKATVNLYYKYQIGIDDTAKIEEADNVQWQAIKEKGMWKVRPRP